MRGVFRQRLILGFGGEDNNADEGGDGSKPTGETDIAMDDAGDIVPTMGQPIRDEARALLPTGEHGCGGHAADRGGGGQTGDDPDFL